MTAFDTCCRIEADGVEDIVRFLRIQSKDGQFVLTDKGRLSSDLQQSIGDALFNSQDDRVWAVEFKVENENKHGNFYLETWSNQKWFNPGWMVKLDADVLMYYFKREMELFVIPFRRLKKWAFVGHDGMGGIYKYPERAQGKYEQLNDTWGRCVPIRTIKRVVGCSHYKCHPDGAWRRVESEYQGGLFDVA